MATSVDIPAMGESITEAVLVRWIKSDGDPVQADEPICELETDKANFDLPAPTAGVLRIIKREGETVRVGETIAQIDASATAERSSSKPVRTGKISETSAHAPLATQHRPEAAAKPANRQAMDAGTPTPDTLQALASGRAEPAMGRDTVAQSGTGRAAQANEPGPATAVPAAPQGTATLPPVEQVDEQSPNVESAAIQPPASESPSDQGIRRVPMSKIRRRIAERLVAAQRQSAMLTTFNEIDMTAVLDLRNRFKERFEKVHGVPLGLFSFFARACIMALHEFEALNAQIDGSDIVYHAHVHLGIAVSTDRGLVVPVLRNVDTMSFGRIESEIKRMAVAARDGKLSLQELSGGTFTITNGGVFGSLVSTPILNPPQSAILGMHMIQKRPVVVNDQIAIRPMMYVALTYDHRLVDGKDSVRFLVRVKELVEEPARMALGI